ncbi:MAG TPA: glycosyltransferase family A protein [Gemmataceae bacterium]|nr:glycosyltransferase family A protein [Gemmataceae bacterium]
MGAGSDYGVDVIIPVYNGEAFILDALCSAARQTYRPEQIIVVDDGSTDRTAEVVRGFHHPGVTVRYVRQPRNLGLSAARNRGIRESTSPYLAFLDADDMWEEGKLETQIAIFRSSSDPKLGIVSAGFLFVNSQGQPITGEVRPRYVRPRGRVLDQLLGGNFVSNGSMALVKRDCFDAVGLFDESLPTCEDWDMWLRIMAHYTFDYTPLPLVKVRVHSSNMSSNQPRMFIGTVMVFSKWTAYAQERPEVLRAWRTMAVPMLWAIVRQLPRTELLRALRHHMAPELKSLLLRQSVPLTFTTSKRAVVKVLRRVGVIRGIEMPRFPKAA